MGAALHPIQPEGQEDDIGSRELATVSQFDRTQEQSLTRALSRVAELEGAVAHLQTDLEALRESLAHAEHKITCHEQLLRNAQCREQELRAQLAQQLL